LPPQFEPTAIPVEAIATESLPYFEEEAKKRQSTSTGGTSPQLVELVPQGDNGIKSRDQAGAAVMTLAANKDDL
jgi:hypothetical protein